MPWASRRLIAAKRGFILMKMHLIDVHDVLYRVEKGAGWVCQKKISMIVRISVVSRKNDKTKLFCFSKISS